jgi:Tol biopolymer transport system component
MRTTKFCLLLSIIIVLASCFRIDKTFPDHLDILYSSESWGTRIIVSDIGGMTSKEICPDSNMIDQVGGNFISENGDIIFSASSSKTHSRNIYLFESDSKEITRLTDTLRNDQIPTISNDANFIMYSSLDFNTNAAELYTLNLNSLNEKQLTFNGHACHNPIFSPNNSNILFCEYFNGLNHLSIIDTSSENYLVLDSRERFYSSYQYSEDGTRIFYTSDSGIISMDKSNLEKNLIVKTDSNYVYGCFLDPLDSVFFYTRKDLINDVYTLNKFNLDLNKDEVLYYFNSPVIINDVDSDRNRILYQKDNDIYLFNIDLESVTKISSSNFIYHSARFNKLLL